MAAYAEPGSRWVQDPDYFFNESALCRCLCEFCTSKTTMLYDSYGYALWPVPMCPDDDCTGKYEDRCSRAHLYDEVDE